MLVPRQQYSRELKMAAMREIESGKGIAEVARMFQVSPKRLETWKGEWRAKGELAFPGNGSRPQAKLDAEQIAQLERKIGQQAMEIEFLKKPCGVSGSIPCQSSPVATPSLSTNPASGRNGGSGERALPGRGSEPGRILSFSGATATQRSRHGFTQPNPTRRAAVARLRLSSRACRTVATGLDGEPQVRTALDAGRQPAVFAAAEVYSDHRLETRAAHLPELGRGDGANGHRSALGGRHHLHPLASGIRVPGGPVGCLFATLHRLGAAAHSGSGARTGGFAHGAAATSATAWLGAPFRPGRAICFAGLQGTTGTTRHSQQQHEPGSKPLRQCPGGEFYQDPQVRGSLQPAALAFCAWLSSAAGVRAKLTILACVGEKTSMSFLRHEEIYRSDVGLGKAGSGNWCRRSQCSSASMSFQSAIPWQVALRQSLPPLHRLVTILDNPRCRTMIFQRTATTPLTSCLSPRVHSIVISSPL